MKNNNKSFVAIVCILLLLACKDDSKDPLQESSILKASMLALRGAAFNNLNDTGCSNSFYKNAIQLSDAFVVDVEYLSADPSSLSQIDIFVKKGSAGTRTALKSIDGSILNVPSGKVNPIGKISIPLSEILGKLAITDPSKLDSDTEIISVQMDLKLKNGTVVPSSSLQNSGVTSSQIFYPAQDLQYCALDIEDVRPNSKSTLRKGKPLKGAASDTLDIVFDTDMLTAPSLAISPVNAGSITAVTRAKDKAGKDLSNKFYAIFTAGASYTGAVTATVSGGRADGVAPIKDLVQNTERARFNVDNIVPQMTLLTLPSRVGLSQLASVKISFNEAMSSLVKDSLFISISGANADAVPNRKMTLAADGLSASYNYLLTDIDVPSNLTQSDLTVTIGGGRDVAGNAFGGTSGLIRCDVGTPPTPSVILSSPYDFGTQIKWTINQSTGASNDGGSTSGTVFWLAVPAGSSAPAQATDTRQGVTVNNGFDVSKLVDGDGNSTVLATGSVSIIGGTSGVIFTNFALNGNIDLYFYFKGSTGNTSPNSTTPLTITMN